MKSSKTLHSSIYLFCLSFMTFRILRRVTGALLLAGMSDSLPSPDKALFIPGLNLRPCSFNLTILFIASKSWKGMASTSHFIDKHLFWSTYANDLLYNIQVISLKRLKSNLHVLVIKMNTVNSRSFDTPDKLTNFARFQFCIKCHTLYTSKLSSNFRLFQNVIYIRGRELSPWKK